MYSLDDKWIKAETDENGKIISQDEVNERVKKDIEELKKGGGTVDNIARTEINVVKSQLEEKASKSDVNLKANKIDLDLKPNKTETNWATLNTFDEDTRRAIQGIAPTSINAVLGYRNVSIQNADFFTEPINLYDKNNVIDGYLVSHTTGVVSANATYNVTKYIIVEPNTKYTLWRGNRIAYYDSSNTFISGLYDESANLILTTPANCAKIRISTLNANKNNQMFAKGEVLPSYIPYSSIIPNKYTEKHPFNIDDVGDNIITENKTTFIEKSKNLFDKATCTDGYYVNKNNGTLAVNDTYSVSDYIPVTEGVQYIANLCNHMGAYYSAKGVFLSSAKYPYDTETVPVGAKYIRLTMVKSDKNSFQFERGNVVTSYSSFGLRLKNNLDASNVTKVEKLILPPKIYIAIGRTIELYDEQVFICGNIQNYTVKYECTIGKTMKRKWTCTPTIVGNYNMTIKVFDVNYNIVTQASTIVQVVNPKVTPQTILAIGDSNTNSKPWQPEWNLLASNSITWIGTRGTGVNKHEGQSGYKTESYAKDSSTQITLNVSGITTAPTTKKKYLVPTSIGNKEFEVETSSISGGSGTILLNKLDTATVYTVNASGSITASDGAGSGDTSINYTSFTSNGNPFWINGSLNFNAYLTNNSLTTPNVINLLLGTNNVSWTLGDYDTVKSTLQKSIDEYKVIIDTIKAQLPSCKIILNTVPYWANQNGLGTDYGNNFNDMQFKITVCAYNELLINTFKSYTNVIICPLHLCFDREYGYGQLEIPVNPRSSVKTVISNSGVHPLTEGYLQWADVKYSAYSAL